MASSAADKQEEVKYEIEEQAQRRIIQTCLAALRREAARNAALPTETSTSA